MRYDSVMSDVVLREEEVGVLRQLSGWPGSFESAAGAAMRRMGFAGVGEFGRAQVGEAGAAFRVAPERVWIRTRDARVWEKAKEADLTLAPMLDLTGSRRVFAVSGEAERVEEVLSRLAGVDFSEGAFEVGGFALAECMGAGVLFYRRGRGEFEVFVSRSWGESFREAAEVAGGVLSGAE